MQLVGRRMQLFNPDSTFGSTDMANVSQVVPSIHPMVSIAPKDVLGHSPRFAEVAASEAGIRGLVDAAKALAMTVVDLLANSDIVSEVKREFERQK